MTKQEEIREGLKQIIWGLSSTMWNPNVKTDEILSYLHSQGVVVKKEFVPPYLPSVIEKEKQILAIVEPLIK